MTGSLEEGKTDREKKLEANPTQQEAAKITGGERDKSGATHSGQRETKPILKW